MVDHLFVTNFPKEAIIRRDIGQSFLLETCQRKLAISFESLDDVLSSNTNVYQGKEAYRFLLEVLCGLKSEILAESEIVYQFKQALQEYIQSGKKDSRIIRLLEKCLKDSKEIRTQYLKEIGQKTYAGIVRKLVVDRALPEEPVLIIGSGQLAVDLINQLVKRRRLFLCARNQEKIREIQQKHDIEVFHWKQLRECHHFSTILCAIGGEETYFQTSFFDHWSERQADKRLFVDLGHPSSIDTQLQKEDGVYRLHDIFERGVIKEKSKTVKIEKAKSAIINLSERRANYLRKQFQWSQKKQHHLTSLEQEAVCSPVLKAT